MNIKNTNPLIVALDVETFDEAKTLVVELGDSVEIYIGRMSSMRHVKNDIREIAQGNECGIGIENYNDIKIGDVLECFEKELVAATL